MRPINRRSLLKGAAGIVGAAGAAALTPILDSPIAQAASPPAGPGTNQIPVSPNVLPTTAGMQYRFVTGTSFSPTESGTPYSYGSDGGIYQPSGSTAWFARQIEVPKGATIQEIRYQVVKNDANGFTIAGETYDPSAGTNSVKYNYTVNPAASASVQSVSASFTSFSYDPAQNTCQIWWVPGSSTLAHRLIGVRVGFTFSGGRIVMLPAPVRVLDTRAQSPGAQYNGGGAFANGTTRTYGTFTALPSDATGIVANLTATGWTAGGYLSIFPAGAALPGTSSLNFSTGAYAWANAVTAGFGSAGNAGHVSIFASVPGGTVHVLLDIVGYTRAT